LGIVKLLLLAGALLTVGGVTPTWAGSLGDWSVEIGTAPEIPQDIWIAAHGNNVDGWNGGGSFCLVGPLPEGGVGVHTVARVYDIEEGGIIGVDGAPVAPGEYLAPGITEPDLTFDVVAGETFYLVFDVLVVNTDSPLFEVGDTFREMLTFDARRGNNDVNMVLWVDFGEGFTPVLNEGTMKSNLHFHP
jgi:hypothetical protein